MAQKGRGIFLVYVDIDAQHDKEFNEWYNTEHLPELLAVPGILAAARYQAVKGGPKYLLDVQVFLPCQVLQDMNPSKIKGSFAINRRQRRDYEWPL
jgi:hypothetical protein